MSPAALLPGPTSRRRGAPSTALALLLAVVLAGCGTDTDPSPAADASAASSSPADAPSGTRSPATSKSDGHAAHEGDHGDEAEETPSASPAATVAVQVRGAEVTPLAQQVDLPVGETLLVTVDADRAGELHVHADPEQLLDFPRGTTEFEITLATPGSVDIEEHEADALVARVLVR